MEPMAGEKLFVGGRPYGGGGEDLAALFSLTFLRDATRADSGPDRRDTKGPERHAYLPGPKFRSFPCLGHRGGGQLRA